VALADKPQHALQLKTLRIGRGEALARDHLGPSVSVVIDFLFQFGGVHWQGRNT
jgi:hypothetical protein